MPSRAIPFAKLDGLHRRNLEWLPRLGLDNLSGEVRDDLTQVWHRPNASPEVPAAHLADKMGVSAAASEQIKIFVLLPRRHFRLIGVFGGKARQLRFLDMQEIIDEGVA